MSENTYLVFKTSGASDSTSGCESGRNYESRTEDSEEGSEQSMEQCLDQLQNLELNGHATSMGMVRRCLKTPLGSQ